MSAFFLRSVILSTLLGLGVSSSAEEFRCENGLVTIRNSPGALHPAICTASDRALSLLQSCDLKPPEPVEIQLSELSDKTCIGLFHCGEALIEVLPPEALDARRSAVGAFNGLPTPRLFESVIVHEIAHAAMEDVPCPYDSCVASSEYFAYSIQLLDLTEAERNLVVPPPDNGTEPTRVTHDQVNALILYMAPDLFITKVWRHVTAKNDVCTQLKRVQDGTLVFDTFHP